MSEKIYILGSGAIGFPLATYLVHAGRNVIAVRTSRGDIPRHATTITLEGANPLTVLVETVSLSNLETLNGLIVVTTKSYANEAVAQTLRAKAAVGPIVLLQNGVGVEKSFLAAGFSAVYRCIVYATGQPSAADTFSFRPMTISPIGIISGDEAELESCVASLNTAGFPFRVEENIQREIWKKAIINSVFNSICPLLDVDNGIFARDEQVAKLALEVVRECVAVTDRLHMELSENELMTQIKHISQGSDGQLISTLQDIKNGRPTEIEFLNLEIVRIATALQPQVYLPRTEMLGKMTLAKSLFSQKG